MEKETTIIYSEETMKLIDNFCLFDDTFMSMVFDGNIEATKLILSIILKRDDIEVIEVVGQREFKGAIIGGRAIRLDIVAKDSTGKIYDIEVQRNDDGAHPRRARYNSSIIDTRVLKAGQKFKEIKDSYVIMITRNDYWKKGLPMYHVNRKVMIL